MKNKILSISFILFLFSFSLLSLFTKKEEVSISERRLLATFPEMTWENVVSGKVTEKLEEYTLDHFILRDTFRSVKVWTELHIFRKQDYNNLYIENGKIFKREYPLKEDKVELFTKKINFLYEKYLQGMNVYYSIIPEKNYYAKTNHLNMDYEKLFEIIDKNMHEDIKNIDIKDSLSLSDYYDTDIHWRQEKLEQVVNKLAQSMNFKTTFHFQQHQYEPFYGSYYGQMGLKGKADTLIYLTNDVIDASVACKIENMETNIPIYNEKALGSVDSYDIYLGGAVPIVTVTNTKNPKGKELILFRDSFGSSLAPLLLEGYSKITLVDLRYITSDLLEEYITFQDQDILFLYNTTIINNSDMLKVTVR